MSNEKSCPFNQFKPCKLNSCPAFSPASPQFGGSWCGLVTRSVPIPSSPVILWSVSKDQIRYGCTGTPDLTSILKKVRGETSE